jgi:hypothetical protein
MSRTEPLRMERTSRGKYSNRKELNPLSSERDLVIERFVKAAF